MRYIVLSEAISENFRYLKRTGAASFDKPYGFSGSTRHTLFIYLFIVEICVLKIKITTTTILYSTVQSRPNIL